MTKIKLASGITFLVLLILAVACGLRGILGMIGEGRICQNQLQPGTICLQLREKPQRTF
jgi:hypothetical protein